MTLLCHTDSSKVYDHLFLLFVHNLSSSVNWLEQCITVLVIHFSTFQHVNKRIRENNYDTHNQYFFFANTNEVNTALPEKFAIEKDETNKHNTM